MEGGGRTKGGQEKDYVNKAQNSNLKMMTQVIHELVINQKKNNLKEWNNTIENPKPWQLQL